MDKEYRLLIAGDLLPTEKNYTLFEAGDAPKLFGDKILQLFSQADYSIINFEGTLTESTIKLDKNGPRLKAPRKTIKGIKNLGVSAVSLANNHTTDYGTQGYLDTINAFDNAGIKYAGIGPKQDNIITHLSIRFGSKRICIYCVSEVFFNVPTENEAGVNIYDEYIVCNEIKELKKNHEYLVVLYHGGAEYFQYPTPLVTKRCHRMADCGADCIITQHTHCIGCEEYYNNTYILHGQGNFLFAHQKKEVAKSGILLNICFNENNVNYEKHLVNIKEDATIRYSEKQDFKDFDRRSKEITNKDLIRKKYQEEKVEELMINYLLKYKGDFPFRKFLLKFFPNKYKKSLKNSYSRLQIIQMINVIRCDRRNEDMLQVWEYLLEQSNKNK